MTGPCFSTNCGEPVLLEWPFFQFSKRCRTGVAPVEHAGLGGVSWKVIADPRFGCPREAAFHLHTFVLVPLLYERYPDIPEVVDLGSLARLCSKLEISDSGHNLANMRLALRQLTAATIETNLKYADMSGRDRPIPMSFSRYQLISPVSGDGGRWRREAIRLHICDEYRRLLANTFPVYLDRAYAAPMRPGAQRFYQLLSSRIRDCVADKGPAEILYSDYCRRAPQKRCFERDAVQKQMYKLHAPHIRSGYLGAKIFYRPIGTETDPDWMVTYSPGPAARQECENARTWRLAGEQLAARTACA
jgi:hypothetical protein